MKFAMAKELFNHGAIADLKMLKVGSKEWLINLIKNDGVSESILLTDKGERRVFKSLDAAYNVAKSIGVCKITIDIPSNRKLDFDPG